MVYHQWIAAIVVAAAITAVGATRSSSSSSSSSSRYSEPGAAPPPAPAAAVDAGDSSSSTATVAADEKAVLTCDIVVAGGSTASLAAAITAATVAPSASVCLTEPTDWPGGQLTSSAVSAIDFGANSAPKFQSKSFRQLMNALGAPRNPGACWVSKMCYQPRDLLQRWIQPTLISLPNLRVMLGTVVTGVEPCGTASDLSGNASRRICALTAVQRRLNPGNNASGGWSELLSATLDDWYTERPSRAYGKVSWRLKGSVFIDATEFGDVLVTGAASSLELPVAQGVEEPEELSTHTDDQCGQAATLTFFMGIRNHSESPAVAEPVPAGSTASGSQFDIPNNGNNESLPIAWTWDDIWLYRRAKLGDANASTEASCPAHHGAGACSPRVGDLTQQNWGGGNDLDNAYLFVPLEQAIRQAKAGMHRGGVNLTAMSMLEQRAFGWYHYFAQHWNESNSSKLAAGTEIYLDRHAVGTATGLAKMPYLRDTRRSIGLDGFRLAYTEIYNPRKFNDTVAIGSYGHDTHSLSTCKMPGYMHAPRSRPYYIPFRALTNRNADNLLVAGKTMATTFSANSATRLHPEEWSSGVAAGAAATLLALNQSNGGSKFETTRDLSIATGFETLQVLLKSAAVQQPLEWGGHSVQSSLWYGCGIADRCYGINDAATAPFSVFKNDSLCDRACPQLSAKQWLANSNYWSIEAPLTLVAKHSTALKKSEVESLALPPAKVKQVSAGFRCQLRKNFTTSIHGYYLCDVS
jgi:hypothetical protein